MHITELNGEPESSIKMIVLWYCFLFYLNYNIISVSILKYIVGENAGHVRRPPYGMYGKANMSGFLGASARMQTKIPHADGIALLPRDKQPWRITGTAKRKQKKRISPSWPEYPLLPEKKAATYSPALQAVPSAWAGLTSLFGMGRGGTPLQ